MRAIPPRMHSSLTFMKCLQRFTLHVCPDQWDGLVCSSLSAGRCVLQYSTPAIFMAVIVDIVEARTLCAGIRCASHNRCKY